MDTVKHWLFKSETDADCKIRKKVEQKKDSQVNITKQSLWKFVIHH